MQSLYLFEDEEENRFLAIITDSKFYDNCIAKGLRPVRALEVGDVDSVWPTDILFSEDMLS